MAQQIVPKNIPENSILGINYSGMHDSAVALVSPQGEPLFAVSLERISRVKQDGRFPQEILDQIPWNKISQVAFSVESQYNSAEDLSSQHLLPELEQKNSGDRSHGDAFFEHINKIDKPKVFIPHHLCHAASTFWVSEFDEAICLVYDGGMANEDWFGAIYHASRDKGIEVVDRFAAHQYANVAYLYSTVTGILGFSPLKHEGKITGLAAYGTDNPACKARLLEWLTHPNMVDGLSYWQDMYSAEKVPVLKRNINRAEQLRESLSEFSKEDLAYAVQKIAEEHILDILRSLKSANISSKKICLSGGLFANVKINQRVSEFGFESVFVSPPMSDDGTALGAALQLASQGEQFNPKPLPHVFLGPGSSQDEIQKLISEQGIYCHTPDPERTLAQEVAHLLANEQIVAVYQGASEYGPRALGNRSILASASDDAINLKLNNRLHRTEFMPFAPMCLIDDVDELFIDVSKNQHTAQFMTITADCKPIMKERCPAVVHCDGTARPQLVTRTAHPFIYDVISHYKVATEMPAIVNTSFNVHEEPIICTAEDALKGFFESGLDYLYLDGTLISLAENKAVEARYLKRKITSQNDQIKQTKTSLDRLTEKTHKDAASQIRVRESLQSELAEAQALQAEAASVLDSTQAELAEATSKLNESQTHLSEAQCALASKQAQLDEVQAMYDAIINSNFWIKTAPLRRLVSLLRGK